MSTSHDEREQREAEEAYRRNKERTLAYNQARREGGALARVLFTPQTLPPGSVGYNAQLGQAKRNRRRRSEWRP